MSKLDLALQETILVKVNEIHKDLVNINKESMDQEDQKGINNSNKMDIDLQAWMEVFEEDQVTVEGCR